MRLVFAQKMLCWQVRVGNRPRAPSFGNAQATDSGHNGWEIEHITPKYHPIIIPVNSVTLIVISKSINLSWVEPVVYMCYLIVWARCPNTRYSYEAQGTDNQIHCVNTAQITRLTAMFLNTYIEYHKDACVQISRAHTKWLPRYKGIS